MEKVTQFNLLTLVRLAALAGCKSSPMSVQAFKPLPSKPADYRIAYGADTNQYGVWRIPAGPGPHPVVVLIHGGCWKAADATLNDFQPMAEALKIAGTADMEASRHVQRQAGGNAVVEGMLGGTPAEVPQRYVESSAIRLLPLGVPQVIVWGGRDDMVPAWLGKRYVHEARQTGDSAEFILCRETDTASQQRRGRRSGRLC